MRKLAAIVAAITTFVMVTPVHLLAGDPVLTGVIRGVVIENSGRHLAAGLQVQLVDSRGVVVPGKTAAVQADGGFALNNVEAGIYTVHVLGAKGTSAVHVTAGRVAAATVTVSAAPRQTTGTGLSTTTKWVIALAAIGGGAVVIGVVATKDKASGSQ